MSPLRTIVILTSLLGISSALAQMPPKDPSEKLPEAAATLDPAAPAILPIPMRGEVGKARIPVKPDARIVAASPELVPLTHILSEQIYRLSGRQLPVATGNPNAGDILLRIKPDLKFDKDPYLSVNPAIKGFEQRIHATAKGVLIEGVNYQSTALATSTFVQSLTGMGTTLAYAPMQIEDKLGSVYAGLMLDIARQYYPVEVLKNMVNFCQFYRIPYLHLHITDDIAYRLPSKAYPQVPTPDGHYSEEELRDLIAYADAHGVTLVPELEMPGHSIALQKAMPEVFGAKDEATGEYKTLSVINVANEEIYPVLEKLIVETAELFKSSPYFHIGGDETNFSEFLANPTVQKQLADLENRKVIEKDQYFSHFLNRIHAIVKKTGKQTICWEGFGDHQKVDTDIIIMAWHGQSHHPEKLLNKGFRVINAPWTPSAYSSLRSNYEWNQWYLNLNEQAISQQFDMTPQVLGGTMLFWERAADEALTALRLKTPARHERLYSPFSRKPFEDFNKRLKGTDAQLERLLFPIDIKVEGLVDTIENLYVDPVKVTLSSPVSEAKLYYNFNQRDVTMENGTLYMGPFTVGADKSVNASMLGYNGPRTILRVRAFGDDKKPIGGPRFFDMRHDTPKFAYTIREVPPNTEKIPDDVDKLPIHSKGVLARLEGSHDLTLEGPPRIFEAKGYIDVRATGTYKCQFLYRGITRKARMRVDGGPWIDSPEEKHGQFQFSFDKTGRHLFEVQQLAVDGLVGIAVTCQERPTETGPNARQFFNDYFSQWFGPLDPKAEKK
jgi:hexosaminidase